MSDRTLGTMVCLSMFSAIAFACFLIWVGVSVIMGPADTTITIRAGEVVNSGKTIIQAEPLMADMGAQSSIDVLAGEGGTVVNSANVVNDYGPLIESAAFLALAAVGVFVALLYILVPSMRNS